MKEYISKEELDEIHKRQITYAKNLKFLEELGIPHFHGEFSVNELSDIFRDIDKLKEILIKVKNKALW